MLSALKKDDEVVTSGGIVGRIVSLDELLNAEADSRIPLFAITFDDGPSKPCTEGLLDAMDLPGALSEEREETLRRYAAVVWLNDVTSAPSVVLTTPSENPGLSARWTRNPDSVSALSVQPRSTRADFL